jgi:hypothetical protein
MAQSSIAQLRFISYIGTQLSGLLTPLLVFHLTHSTTLAGIALLVEWLPKLVFYLAGGSLAQVFGYRKSHLVLEVIRLAAFGLFMLCILGYGSVWLVAFAAASYQCCNALSNVLFELVVMRHWPEEQYAHGHTLMVKKCQQGCFVGLLLGLAVGDLQTLCLFAILVQGLCTLQVARNLTLLYPDSGHANAAFNLLATVRRDLAAAGNARLIHFSLSAMLMSVPIALMFSSLPFLLERAQPGLVDEARILSLVLLCRAGLSILLLEVVQRRLHASHSPHRMAVQGCLLMLAGVLLAILPLSLAPALLAIMLVGVSMYMYVPWLRVQRQQILSEEVQPESRAGATGILISVEASSWLMGAALLALFGSDLSMALAFSALLAIIGLLLQRRNFVPAHFPLRTPGDKV